MNRQLDQLSLADIWQMFRLRKWIFLMLVIGLTGLFALGIHFIPNTYEASATILLEQKPIAETGVGTVKLTPDLEQRLRIFKTLVMSEYLLRKVIAHLKLVPNIQDPLAVQEKIEELRQGITVKIQGTDSLQIFYQGKDPRLVMQITNELANFFLEDTLQYMEKSLGGTMRFLEDQLASTETQLEEQEQKIMAFKARHYDELPQHITGHQSSLDRLLLQTENLETAIRDLARQKKQAQLHLAELEASFGLVEQGKDANALLQQKLLKLETLKSENTPQHPDVIALEKEIAGLEKTLNEVPAAPSSTTSEQQGEVHPALAQSMEYQTLKQQILDFTAEIARLEAKKPALKNKIQDHQESLHAAHEREQEYVKLTRGYEVLKERYQALFNKKLDAQLSTRLEQVQQEEKFQILDAATVPFEPVWPNRLLLTLIGGVVAVAIGTGIVLLLGFMDQRIYAPEQLANVNAIPVLGAIPNLSQTLNRRSLPSPNGMGLEGKGSDPPSRWWFSTRQYGTKYDTVLAQTGSNGNGAWAGMSPMLVMAHHADWFSMEQYRYLRTHVKQASREFPHPVILVTSAHPGEGKSVTASNLAVALALEGEQDILLIDGELRKPNIHCLFGLEQSPGLANVLTGTTPLEDVIHQGPAKRLKIIAAGETHLHPADLLGSRQCDELLAHLRTRFAYIIIDSPPLLAVTDGRILSHWVDGVMLVVRSGATRQDVYHDAAKHLAGQRVLGVVVNSLPANYFSQRYGNASRYGYYGRPEVKSLPG